VRALLSIQYLRAIAALAVVFYHAGQWVMSPLAIGAAGVDIFFLVSGFVMWTSTWGHTVRPLDFLSRRAVRVVPLYWLATLALAVVVLLLPGVVPNATVQGEHILKSLLFIPHYNPQGSPFPLLAVGWTLTYEAVFYLAFAVALLARPDERMGVLVGILVPLSALGIVVYPLYPLFANPMLLQFLVGAIIGRLWLSRTAQPSPRTGLVLAAVGAVALAVSQGFEIKPEDLYRPLFWGLPAACLVMGVVAAEPILPAAPILRRIGDASYSIYLVHTTVMAFANKAIGHEQSILFFCVAVALSIAAGLACHAAIERPLLTRLRLIGSARARAAASA